jgi:triphosphoribosyl-dephospho-CoA synthase
LPFFNNLKKKVSKEKAIQMLYLEYASKSPDSHLLRKFGSCKANSVMKMFKILSLQIFRNPNKNFDYQIRLLDTYLKNFNYNPGTCADLTVTTLLIDKIKDIFKFQL